jgi:hypothetical protein
MRMAIIDEPTDAIDRKADACVVGWIADAVRDWSLVTGMPKRMGLDQFTAAIIADGPIRTKPAK